MKKKDKVIRGKFRLGENQFPSLREKSDKVMRDIEKIQQKAAERVKASKPE
ncbi:hypothetical protein [Cohnella silvisoli]|uniref:Uncharacterized protein n=1 Tax=Cohnella silvisoli TaxID=2873699 RepID=A0ABV1KU85_9BACL|nr:hypothetical protein [Cohnella silvisoli]MCD9023193.1 hypothetical protein [Cohnella silvisoli]